MECPQCHANVLDIDVKCSNCGAGLGASGAHRMIGQVVLGQYENALGHGGAGFQAYYDGDADLLDRRAREGSAVESGRRGAAAGQQQQEGRQSRERHAQVFCTTMLGKAIALLRACIDRRPAALRAISR